MKRNFDIKNIGEVLQRNQFKTEAFLEFNRRTSAAKQTLDVVRNSKSVEAPILMEALYYLLITHISALEVFFKETIMQYSGSWHAASELLKDKISMQDAYDLFQVHGVYRETLITHIYSIQSIDGISFVFDKLVGRDFFVAVGDYSVVAHYEARGDTDEFTLNSDYGIWRRQLVDAFELRNKIVHDNISGLAVSDDTIMAYTHTISLFIYISNAYISSFHGQNGLGAIIV